MTQEWHIEMEGKLEELWGSTPEGQALPSFEGTRLIDGSLEAVDADQLMKRKKVMVWMTGPIKIDARTLFERLERVDPGLRITLWRPYDKVTTPSGTRFFIGVDEASVGTIAGPGFRSSIGLHKAIFSFLNQANQGPRQRLRHLENPRRQTSSTYLPYDAPNPPPNRELEDLVNFCKTKSWDLLVGCDSNSYHSVWGSSDVNPRGESLLEYLLTTELQLLNRGSQPTFRNNVREEVIDITL
ncbi:hypothetical protein J437_LFUL014194 [Ladona fulva]|uniref:Endonuclease/exonuclease/phosphatase domain-containing protein n=1 Tax=Ladona fulva TaxID=123851 RepID=A0A8K0KLH7_LADFU|nr:hypothetical protein J437_LFUL014194 [Ladona fulva]